MTKVKSEPFEEWANWKLRFVPYCQGADGERKLYWAIVGCAFRYPERTREWAGMLNKERCRPPFKGWQLEKKIRAALAYSEKEGAPCGSARNHKPQPTCQKTTHDASSLKQAPENVTLGTSDPAASFLELGAFSFLSHLYRPGEKVFVTDTLNSERGFTLTVGSMEAERTIERIAQNNRYGVFFSPNPISDWIEAPAGGLPPYRTGIEKTNFRYIAFEIDLKTEMDWLDFLKKCPLPIISDTHSGGQTIHIVVRVDAQSREEWEYYAGIYSKIYGIQPQPMSRLPGCRRGTGGKMQRLRYLNHNLTLPEGGAR